MSEQGLFIAIQMRFVTRILKQMLMLSRFPKYCIVLLTKFTIALQTLCKSVYENHETILVAL